jgi:uncharacterized protein YjaG (DUF416 family)
MISPDYLPDGKLIHFERIKRTIDLAFEQVIESLSEKRLLSYIPNIYPVPFMIAKADIVQARMVRTLFYSVVYPDKSNFENFAIYPTLTLIERLPDCLIGAIAHEIAHIISVDGKVSISKTDFTLVLRNRPESAKTKEKKAQTVYKHFSESMLSEIKRWDHISMKKDIEEIVSNDVQLISQQSFDRMVFKEKLAEYHDFIRSKLAGFIDS